MYTVSLFHLVKEYGIWQDDTMSAPVFEETFETLEDAQTFYARLDPKDTYETEVSCAGFTPQAGLGYCARIAEEVEEDDGWIDYTVIEEKTYTTDDARA